MGYLPDVLSRAYGGGNGAAGSFEIEVCRGRMRGMEYVDVRGRNGSVTGSMVELWEGNSAYLFPTGTAALFLSSSDASDTSAGAGGRSVVVKGLGRDFESYVEVVPLNGTTLVQTTGSFVRTNHCFVSGCGSHQGNRGTIQTWHNGVTLVSIIASGSGHDSNAIYTVPSGTYALLRQLYVHASFDAPSRYRIMYRPGGSGSAFIVARDVELMNADDHAEFGHSHFLPPRTDIKCQVQATRAGNVTGGPMDGGITLITFDQSTIDLEPR